MEISNIWRQGLGNRPCQFMASIGNDTVMSYMSEPKKRRNENPVRNELARQGLAEHLGWSHLKEILYLKDELARQFYAEICRLERWSVRTLRDRVRSMMFERTAIFLPEATIRQDLEQLKEAVRLTPELVFRDPYLLDFLGLKDTYSDRDLEAGILRELERFLLELGTDFAFVARQKR